MGWISRIVQLFFTQASSLWNHLWRDCPAIHVKCFCTMNGPNWKTTVGTIWSSTVELFSSKDFGQGLSWICEIPAPQSLRHPRTKRWPVKETCHIERHPSKLRAGGQDADTDEAMAPCGTCIVWNPSSASMLRRHRKHWTHSHNLWSFGNPAGCARVDPRE